jgi:hypothetical protein
MFSLFPAFQSLSTSRRFLVLLPLPLALAGALAWPGEGEAPLFPPVPTLADQDGDRTPGKQAKTRKPVLPRRDPFRPLNHPAHKKELPAPAAVPPAAPGKPVTSSSPASPYRLLGILTVNGERRALVASPRGTVLAALGEALPGKGPVTAFHSSSLECDGRELSVGEVWP